MDDRELERVAVAEAARRAIRAIRVTEASAETLAQAASLLEEAAALLGDEVHDGPHCQTGWGRDGFRMDTDPGRFFPYSPVVGPLNPLSPPLELTVTDDGEITGTMHLTEAYNGPPWDLTHGGVVALVFDELLGLAGIAGAGGGFTGRLTVRYRRPTPILADVDVRAWLERSEGRKIVARGEMRHDGVVTAEAEGLFIKVEGPLREEP